MQRPMSPAKYRALATYFPKSVTFQTWCSLFKRAKSPVCCIVWDDEEDEIIFSLVDPSHAFQHMVVESTPETIPYFYVDAEDIPFERVELLRTTGWCFVGWGSDFPKKPIQEATWDFFGWCPECKRDQLECECE